MKDRFRFHRVSVEIRISRYYDWEYREIQMELKVVDRTTVNVLKI